MLKLWKIGLRMIYIYVCLYGGKSLVKPKPETFWGRVKMRWQLWIRGTHAGRQINYFSSKTDLYLPQILVDCFLGFLRTDILVWLSGSNIYLQEHKSLKYWRCDYLFETCFDQTNWVESETCEKQTFRPLGNNFQIETFIAITNSISCHWD